MTDPTPTARWLTSASGGDVDRLAEAVDILLNQPCVNCKLHQRSIRRLTDDNERLERQLAALRARTRRGAA